MFTAAALVRNPKRIQIARTKSVPAPVGGWNDRDPLAAMDEKDAVILDNFWPLPSKVMVRKGCIEWATGMPSQVESLMAYEPATGTSKLIAASGTKFYDATLTGVLANYLNLTGAATTYAATPNAAANRVFAGDIDLIAYVSFAVFPPAAAGTIIAKYSNGANQRCYKMVVNTSGYLRMNSSSDGTTGAGWVFAISTSVIPAAAGTGIWVRATLDVNDGSGNRVHRFYTSTDDPTTAYASISWTQLGNTVTDAGTTSIYAGDPILQIGASDATVTTEPFIGKIYRAAIYNGILGSGGTLVVSFNASDARVAATTVTSADTTEVYTLTGEATIAGTVVQVGLTNARWQHTCIATAGGNFLLAVNGVDKLRGWNGTAWWTDGDGTHDITGIDTASCIQITNFKRRIWMVEKSSTRAWYLPVDSIAGAAASLDFGSIFPHGGYLMAIANWTLDGGDGPDDYSAFIGSNGDVAVYRGTDPSSAATWAIVGVFWIGSPVGRRCCKQYRGDVLVISQDGVFPLSQVLLANRTNTAIAYTDKIQNTISRSVTDYGTTFGWQLQPFAGQNMLILNVPLGVGIQQQYVMNTISGAWCRFKGWPANCFELFANELYYGGNGVVYKAWQNFNDVDANIPAEGLQAFNYFGDRSSLKEWTLARPLLSVSNSCGFYYGLNTDFDTTAPSGTPSFAASSIGKWGVSRWGAGRWGGAPVVQKGWQSVAGTGYCATLHVLAATNTGQVEWSATDYAFKSGGVL